MHPPQGPRATRDHPPHSTPRVNPCAWRAVRTRGCTAEQAEVGPIDTKEWTPADTLRLFAAVAENRVARIRQVRARGGAERAAMARRRSARAAVRPAVAHRSRSPFWIWHFFSLVELRGVASLFPARSNAHRLRTQAQGLRRMDLISFPLATLVRSRSTRPPKAVLSTSTSRRRAARAARRFTSLPFTALRLLARHVLLLPQVKSSTNRLNGSCCRDKGVCLVRSCSCACTLILYARVPCVGFQTLHAAYHILTGLPMVGFNAARIKQSVNRSHKV